MCTVSYNNWHVISKFQYACSNCVHSLQQCPLPRVYAACFLQHGIVKIHNQRNLQWFRSCDYWYSFCVLRYLNWGFSVFFTQLLCKCHVRQAGSQTSPVTSPLSIPVWCTVLQILCVTITRVQGTLQFKLMTLCHSQVTLMLSTDINITETTSCCQFQYEFGNQ
jgi:hypothetical protein